MSVLNFVVNDDLRLLQVPWKSMAKSWNAAALTEARQKALAWEQYYPDYRKKVRHADSRKKPIVPVFEKVQPELIAPMMTLGGKPK